MARTHRGMLTTMIGAACTATLLLAATPAMAGDSGSALRSPVGHWKTSTNGVKQDVTFTKDGNVFGDSGCNRFTGGYTVHGDRIEIGPLASTLMACPQKQMDAEAVFLKALQASTSYSATATTLKLHSPGTTLVLRKAK